METHLNVSKNNQSIKSRPLILTKQNKTKNLTSVIFYIQTSTIYMVFMKLDLEDEEEQ